MRCAAQPIAPGQLEGSAALAQQPHFLQAWFGLEDLYVAGQRWDELEDVARHLEQEPHAKSEVAVTRARAHLGRKEYEAAKELLRGAIAVHPHAFRPWFILSHVLLLEHKDLPAAEQALREVLALDPNNEGTRQNLALLLREMGRAS